MIDYGEYIRTRIAHTQSTDTADGYPCELTSSLGNQLLNYKIYGDCAQNGIPDTSNHIDIVSVGDLVTDQADKNYGKYKIPVVAYGKNFLNCTYPTGGYIYGTVVNKDFSITVKAGSNNTSSPINIRESKPYTIPADNTTLTASCKNAYDKVKMVINVKKADSAEFDCYTLTSDSLTLTLSKGDSIQVYLQISANGVISKTITLYPQLESGDTATAFEPYIRPSITNIYLDEPLRKIGNYSDYIDFKRQVVIRQIKEHVISKSSKWNDWQSGNGSRVAFYTSQKLYGNNLTTLGYFNSGIISQSMNYSKEINVLCANNSTYTCFWYPDYREMGLDGSEDIATANAALQDWLKSMEDMYFTYVLATPVEQKIFLPVIPIKKGNIFIATNTSLPSSNISVKYSAKP